MNSIVKIILATVVGEIILIILTTVAQEVLVDGVSLNTSSNPDLIIGGIATLFAGAIAGAVATLIVGNNDKLPVLIICILIVVESTYLIASGKVSSPIWFDILSAIALIASVSIGYYIVSRVKQ